MGLPDIAVTVVFGTATGAVIVGFRKVSDQLKPSKSPVVCKIIGSLLATCAGAIAGSICAFIFDQGLARAWLFPALRNYNSCSSFAGLAPSSAARVFSRATSLGILATVTRNRHRSLWRAGILALLLWRGWSVFWPLLPVAIVVGAVTCYYASAQLITSSVFRRDAGRRVHTRRILSERGSPQGQLHNFALALRPGD